MHCNTIATQQCGVVHCSAFLKGHNNQHTKSAHQSTYSYSEESEESGWGLSTFNESLPMMQKIESNDASEEEGRGKGGGGSSHTQVAGSLLCRTETRLPALEKAHRCMNESYRMPVLEHTASVFLHRLLCGGGGTEERGGGREGERLPQICLSPPVLSMAGKKEGGEVPGKRRGSGRGRAGVDVSGRGGGRARSMMNTTLQELRKQGVDNFKLTDSSAAASMRLEGTSNGMLC